MVKVPPHIPRFQAPDSYFGKHDRSVPVVVEPDPATRRETILLEEYLVEQLPFEIVGDVIRLKTDLVNYSPTLGLVVDPSLDRPAPQRTDSVPVQTFADYDRWILEE